MLDRALIAEMGALGLLGVDLPEELGGLGADAVTTGLIAEELAYGDFNLSAVPVGHLAATPPSSCATRSPRWCANGCRA